MNKKNNDGIIKKLYVLYVYDNVGWFYHSTHVNKASILRQIENMKSWILLQNTPKYLFEIVEYRPHQSR